MALDEESELLLTIPLGKLRHARSSKRASQAIDLIRKFVAKHMKADEKDIWIDPRINELIWKRGISRPPTQIRVKLSTLEEEEKIGVELPPKEEEEEPEPEE